MAARGIDLGRGPSDPRRAPGAAAETPDAPIDPAKKKRRIVIGVALAVVVAIGASLYGWRSTYFEDTDDAQIDGYISNLSPRVGGTVVAVQGDDNRVVHTGDLLVAIDPLDYRVARDQAKAALAQTVAQLKADRPAIGITEVSNRTTVSTTASDVSTAAASIAESERAYAVAEAQLLQSQANDH